MGSQTPVLVMLLESRAASHNGKMTATLTFDWQLHPRAQELVDGLVDDVRGQSPAVGAFLARLADATSTRTQDWLDFIGAPVGAADLAAVGYVEGFQTVPGVWRHPGAQLPAIVITDEVELALRVDDVAAFAQASRSIGPIHGAALSGFRRVVAVWDSGVTISGVERRSWTSGITPETFDQAQIGAAAQAWQTLAERPRALVGADGVRAQLAAAEHAVALVGPDLAASYFLQLERQYWQRSNTAGLLQFARQDRLGLGWGNNDHHTFRSSRAAFAPLITLLDTLGFAVREQFYAGAEAGWGAQVMEHPGCGGVIFADVDLRQAEIEIDFAHSDLELDPGADLGTVGMWCALHGESVLEAGMHHLEGQFEFEALRDDLAERGIGSMKPFSEFAHLRQAFTQAERWPVPPERVRQLVAAGQLGTERGEQIIAEGAPGSHLENLARRDGFKGFNQHNVSMTMKATHPRDYRPS